MTVDEPDRPLAFASDDRLRGLYEQWLATRTTAARADCPDVDALIAAVERRGAETDRVQTVNHAMQCAACRSELELIRATTTAARAAPVPRSTWTTSVWHVGARMAVAAGILVAVSLGATALVRRFVTPHAAYRGGTGDVALVAPTGAVHADATLTFVWRPVPGAARYTVDIFRDDGVQVASATVLGDTTIGVPAPTLAAGARYRWSVAATDTAGRTRRSLPVAFTVAR